MLTWGLVVGVPSAELDVSLLVARWGGFSSSSLRAAQSPKTMQVSPGFYVNTYYLALKVNIEGHSVYFQKEA